MRGWLRLAVVGSAIVALAATGIILTRSPTQAATCTNIWLGGVDNNFATAGNWSKGTVPSSADDVCITQTTTTRPAAVADTYTVLDNGSFTIRSLTLGGPNGTQTLVIRSNFELDLGVDSTVNSNGVLTLGDAGAGNTILCCAPVTMTNGGHLNTVAGGGGSRYWRLSVTNGPGAAIDLAGPTLQDGGGGGSTRTTNSGTFVVDATGSLAIGGGGNPQFFVNSGGSITNNGAFSTSSSTFTQRGGTESGNPIVLGNVTVLDDDLSAGAALFKLANGSQNLADRK